jgi:hypothetical protein
MGPSMYTKTTFLVFCAGVYFVGQTPPSKIRHFVGCFWFSARVDFFGTNSPLQNSTFCGTEGVHGPLRQNVCLMWCKHVSWCKF